MSVKDEPLHIYESGANRSDRTGKGRFDLVPPLALARLARHYEVGGVLHGDRNWEFGFPISRCCDSVMRHIGQYIAGDRSEDHLAAVGWQVFAAMHFEEKIAAGALPAALDDIPHGD
jgi:hypothetical protein